MFGAILGGGLALAGGVLGAKSAKDAAEIQAGAANEATAENRRQFDVSRSDLAPWRDAGGDAVNRIRMLLGLGGGSGPEFGSLNKKFTLEDFENDPVNQLGMKFGLDEGSKALRRMYGAKGMARSGAAIKGLTRYGTDYAGSKAGESRNRFLQDQDVIFNRLSGVSGTGQTATTNTAQIGAQSAATTGALNVGSANARGAAAIAGGNAYSNALSTIGGQMNTRMLLDSLNNRGSVSSSSPSPAFSMDNAYESYA